MFKTIINELNAVENVELGTQISILALLFHNIVILPLLGCFGPILAPLGPNYGVNVDFRQKLPIIMFLGIEFSTSLKKEKCELDNFEIFQKTPPLN